MSVPSLIRIERGSGRAHVFKLNKVARFSRKPVNINVSRSAVPQLALVPASRYYCGGAHVLKLYKVALFARKPVNINVSRSAAPILALVPASRYNCDVKYSYVNACAKFN